MQSGRATVELIPGDMVFGPAQAQAGFDFRSNCRQFMVSVPRAILKARPPGSPVLALGHLSGRTGRGRMFSGTLTALADAFDTLEDNDLAPVESSLSEFIATTLAAQRDPASPAVSSTQAATMRRLGQFVDWNLSDPALPLAAVAAHARLSERLVQRLFEGLGQTFTAYLRQRRLERARADLANRQYGHLSTSDICFRGGFNEPAHFSHCFRDRYSMSPRQYRQQANKISQQSLRKRVWRGWPSGYFELPTENPVTFNANVDSGVSIFDSASALSPAVPADPPGVRVDGRVGRRALANEGHPTARQAEAAARSGEREPAGGDLEAAVVRNEVSQSGSC